MKIWALCPPTVEGFGGDGDGDSVVTTIVGIIIGDIGTQEQDVLDDTIGGAHTDIFGADVTAMDDQDVDSTFVICEPRTIRWF